MLAYDYPILGLFWSMLLLFFWIAWIVLVIRVVADIFRADIRGVSKALWVLFVVAVPFLGVFAYLIAHGDSMTKREVQRVQTQASDYEDYIRGVAGSGQSVSTELANLAGLRDRGVLSAEEFEAAKARALST